MELGSKVGNFGFWDENVFGLGNSSSLFSNCCLKSAGNSLSKIEKTTSSSHKYHKWLEVDLIAAVAAISSTCACEIHH